MSSIDPLEQALRGLLPDGPPNGEGGPGSEAPGANGRQGRHLDDLRLATWIDHVRGDAVLDVDEREAVEAHLAACADCRDLARDAYLAVQALESPAQKTAPAPEAARTPETEAEHGQSPQGESFARDSRPLPPARARRPWLSTLAALLLLTAGLAWLRTAGLDPRLGSHGVGLAERVTADRGLLADASRLLDGRGLESPNPEDQTGGSLAPLPTPDQLGQAPGQRALSSHGPGPPEPVALRPRWETVIESEPVFAWVGEATPEAEISILDANDRLALRFTCRPRAHARARSCTLPASAGAGWSELRAGGGVFAWKVNLEGRDGLPIASGYVPFRMLDPAAARELARQRGDASELMDAAILARAGAYSAALGRLAGAVARAGRGDDGSRLAELAGPLFDRQHLEPGLRGAALELARDEPADKTGGEYGDGEPP